MKLLIILLCLASDRYLIHTASQYRSRWLSAYFTSIGKGVVQSRLAANPYILLMIIVLPLMVALWVLLAVVGNLLYGFAGLFINLLVFYFCLSTENPFYPVSHSEHDLENESGARTYFIKAHSQLFALIFWFVFTGSIGLLFYRLLYDSASHESTRPAANRILGWLDWVTARVTLLFYLLAGNFQQGFQYCSGMFFSSPDNNSQILATGGLLAARVRADAEVTLPAAQILVEHALIIFLVLLALFTIVAWL